MDRSGKPLKVVQRSLAVGAAVAVTVGLCAVAACSVKSVPGELGSGARSGPQSGELPGVGAGGGCPCTIGDGISYTIACGSSGCVSMNGVTEGISCDSTGAHDDPAACSAPTGERAADAGAPRSDANAPLTADVSAPPAADASAPPAPDASVFSGTNPCSFSGTGHLSFDGGACSMVVYNGNGGLPDGTGGAFIIITPASTNASLQVSALTLGDPKVALEAGTYSPPLSGSVTLMVAADAGLPLSTAAFEWQPNVDPDAGSGSFTFSSVTPFTGQFLNYEVHGSADFSLPCETLGLTGTADAGCEPEQVHLVF